RRGPDPEGTPPGGRSRLHRPCPEREGGRGTHAEADHEVPAEQDSRRPICGDVRPLRPGLQGRVRVPRAEARGRAPIPFGAATRVPAGTAGAERTAGIPRRSSTGASHAHAGGPPPEAPDVPRQPPAARWAG